MQTPQELDTKYIFKNLENNLYIEYYNEEITYTSNPINALTYEYYDLIPEDLIQKLRKEMFQMITIIT